MAAQCTRLETDIVGYNDDWAGQSCGTESKMLTNKNYENFLIIMIIF